MNEDPNGKGRCPEGIEIQINIYLTSDAEGLDFAASVSGLTTVPSFTKSPSAKELFKLLGVAATLPCDDVRLMTREEISEYKRRERE